LNYGTFYPTNSFWHRRDPRLKLLVMVTSATLTVTENRLSGQLFFLLVHAFLFYSARLPSSRAWKTISSFRWLLLLTFLANLIFVSVNDSFLYLSRLLNLLLASSWLLGTSEPLTIIRGLELIFKPFSRWLPVADVAMILGLSLGFFPLLQQEATEITIAQRARGVTFEGKWWKKITGLLAMVVPLFITSFRRSMEVAQAMEARGYIPGRQRGSLYELKWVSQDTWSLLLTLIFAVLWSAQRMLS